MQVNTESTELALKAASTEISNFVVNAEAEVKAIEDKFSSIVPDASSKDGYAFCKSVRKDLMPIKSGLEGARKTLKAPILAAGKLVDGNLNPLADRIVNVMTPFVKAYQDVDNEKKRKEEARVASVQAGFDQLNNALLTASGSTSTVIETMIDELADFEIDPRVYKERADEVAKLHGDVMERLSVMLQQALNTEEMEAKKRELEGRERAIREKEEAEQAEAAKQARDAELQAAREEAEAKAKEEAELRHKQELESAEQRRVDEAKQAEARAKEQAEASAKAERERIEQEQLQAKREAEKREANKKHQAAIHNEILDAMQSVGISSEHGKAFIKLVATRQAGSIQINY